MAVRTITADEFTVIVDSRERLPYKYPGMVNAALPTGDYSVAGFEGRIALERKSFDDLVGCVTRDRDRFEKQVQRLGAMEYGALIIEEDSAGIMQGHELSQVDPAAVLGTLLSWSVKWGVPVWLCSGRDHARAITYRLLQHFVRAAAREIPEEEDGRGEVRCWRCHRVLHDPVSRMRGIGPICYEVAISEGQLEMAEVVA